jgi:L-asparagine transporter-like permease
MDFLKNIAVNIRATGPAAVLISLIAGITLLGLFGQGELARSALNILAFATGALGLALAQRI